MTMRRDFFIFYFVLGEIMGFSQYRNSKQQLPNQESVKYYGCVFLPHAKSKVVERVRLICRFDILTLLRIFTARSAIPA